MASQYDIGEKSVTQIHWENQSPINDRLKSIVEPLADSFSEKLQRELEGSSPDDRHELIEQAGNAYELPYGRVGILPPAIFGDITKDSIELEEELKVPKKKADIERLADRYDSWAWQQTSGRMRYSFPDKDTVVKMITEVKGLKYPKGLWLTSAEEMQRALNEERAFSMDIHRHNRWLNGALDYDQLNPATQLTHKQHDDYVLVMSKEQSMDGYVQGTRDYTQLPVGAYGSGASKKLARVTTSLNDFIKTSPSIEQEIRDSLDPDVEDLLAKHTARTREKYEDGSVEPAVEGLKNILTEGVVTIAQTLSFLTADKVEGYETHDELVEALLNTDIIEQVARIVNPGYIGPVTLSGLYMPNPLEVKDGKLKLNKEVVKVFNEMRKEHVAKVMAEWALYKTGKGKQPQMLGVTCPAAAPKGAISTVKGVMRTFYTKDTRESK